MRLTLTAPAAITATDTDARRLRGIAIPYGVKGYTSAGPLTIDAGAIRVPENLRAIKLFREHGRVTPLGYAIEADDDDQSLRMGFAIARTPDGDQSLVEASEGLRDALSVELNDVTLENGHVTAADLVAVAQVAVPAFAGAQLTGSLSDDEQAQVADLAQQITEITTPEETTDDEPAADDAEQPTEGNRTMTETTEAAAAPATMTMIAPPSGVNAAQRAERDRRLFAAQAAEALRGATDAGQVNAALADITPANAGTAGVFPRPAWLGELWEPQAANRPLVDAIGVSPLTSMTMQGWKWQTKPEVAPYAGNKAAVPSSPAVIVPAEATAQRIAGGWDLDRIYVDFNTGFVDAFLRAAVADYKKKSGTYFLSGHGAITGPPAVPAAEGIMDDATDLGAQASLLAGLQAIAAFLVGNGANLSFVAMAGDVFADFLTLPATEVPWWLQNQGSVSLTGGVTAAGVVVGIDPGLAPGEMLGGDRDAVSLWETGPINVQAINIPNGGVDLGLFGYWAQQVHDDDGLAKCTVTAVTTAGARTAKKSS